MNLEFMSRNSEGKDSGRLIRTIWRNPSTPISDYPSWQELVFRIRQYFEEYHGGVPPGTAINQNDVAKLSLHELQEVFQSSIFSARFSSAEM
jgi:hypothetical protein